MKIGVISDTHGDVVAIRRAVQAAGPVDLWLHAGDYSQDGHYLAELTGLPVYAAHGNCDGTTKAKVDEFIDAGGIRIWLTHGHKYPAKTRREDLVWWGERYEVDVVIYGHTHVPDITWHNNLLIFNPGSAAHPRGGSRHSYGVLTISAEGRVQPSIMEL